MKDKKIKFIMEVENSAEILGVPKPSVRFWKDKSHFERDERAHIHLETKIICISEKELEKMSYEEIRETASHEVSHLINPSHDEDFYQTQTNTESGLWRPPAGITHVVDQGDLGSKTSKNCKKKVDKRECNYYSCKDKKNLKKCKYCNGLFCPKHISPREPYIGLKSGNLENNKHPCFGYFDHQEKVRKEADKKYSEALDKLCRLKSRNKEKYYYNKNDYLENSNKDDINLIALKKFNKLRRKGTKKSNKHNFDYDEDYENYWKDKKKIKNDSYIEPSLDKKEVLKSEEYGNISYLLVFFFITFCYVIFLYSLFDLEFIESLVYGFAFSMITSLLILFWKKIFEKVKSTMEFIRKFLLELLFYLIIIATIYAITEFIIL